MSATQPEMTPERTEAIARMLLDTINSEPRQRARRRRIRLTAWTGVGIFVLGGAATAGTIAMNSASVSNTELVHCLSSDTRDKDGSYPGAAATLANSDGRGRVNDAISLCKVMWQQGVLSADHDPTAATNPLGQVPQSFEVCVMSDGSAAVVPSDVESVCRAIGLAPLRAD